ncbi:MAG: alpha/beta fold hydrolase [Raoultibacter sp.]|jgi:dienelactone hydrolase
MKKIALLCTVLSLVLLCAGCQNQQPTQEPEATVLSEERVEELHTLSVQFTEYLSTSDIDAAMAMMDDAMTSAVDGKLEETWTQLVDSAGAFIETDAYTGMTSGEYEAIEMTLVFENASLIQRIVFDSNNQISGLRYRNGKIEATTSSTLPDRITETAVTIDAGDGYPLDGMLTMPKNGTPTAAIVLVQGSGPSDMNATIGANAVFRDLAYALAEKGIAVLRYDKRTYTHGAAIAENGGTITLDDEVARDALTAVELIKSWDGIDSDRVYLLGHSMGGSLLSYVNSHGANCAGYIIMAGTARNIWELSAEQNLLLAEEMEQAGKADDAKKIRDFVDQERQRANSLDTMSSEETLFGMPASYLQEFDEIDTISLHLADELPVLILQGEKDRQVYMTDYTLWQEGLDVHPAATFISYPTLNHLFGEYIGDTVPFSQMVHVEYAQRTPVEADVVNDIVVWIGKLS